MRILHTSDWHLGRSFHGFSLLQETTHILEELIQCIEAEKVEVLLISGDVYDQAQPRVDMVKLFSQTLSRIRSLGCTVIATSGNHDSAIRLGFAAEVLAAGGVHFLTDPDQVATPVILENKTEKIAFYGIPYLEPRALAPAWETVASHAAVLEKAVAQIRQAPVENLTASIALAHCFVSGMTTSESERDLSVGGVASVGADIFADFDYVALGHLHGRQKVSETMRYSGSLLAYSFSEEKHRKGAWLIDTNPHGTISVSAVDWKNTTHLHTLTGELEDLLTQQEYAQYESAYVRINLTDQERPHAAIDRLKTRFSKVAELFFTPPQQKQREKSAYGRAKTSIRSAQDVAGDFFEHVRQRELNESELQLVRAASEEAQKGTSE